MKRRRRYPRRNDTSSDVFIASVLAEPILVIAGISVIGLIGYAIYQGIKNATKSGSGTAASVATGAATAEMGPGGANQAPGEAGEMGPAGSVAAPTDIGSGGSTTPVGPVISSV